MFFPGLSDQVYIATGVTDMRKSIKGIPEGCVQTDGYSGYNFLDYDDKIRHIGCWAHARRKFMDVIKAQGKKRKSGTGDRALSYIRKFGHRIFRTVYVI